MNEVKYLQRERGKLAATSVKLSFHSICRIQRSGSSCVQIDFAGNGLVLIKRTTIRIDGIIPSFLQVQID